MLVRDEHVSEVAGDDCTLWGEIVELGCLEQNDVEEEPINGGVELGLAGQLASIESCDNRRRLIHDGTEQTTTRRKLGF